MRVVVTGATGFVGSHLAERLVAERADVDCLVRPSSRLGWLRPLPVRLRETSLFDREGLRQELGGAEVVFHVAGRIRARSDDEYERDNVLATELVTRACLEARPAPRRLVVVSSQAAAGPAGPGSPAREDAPSRPISAYGRSKLAAERSALALADRLEVAVVRPSTVYGPRDQALLPLFRLVRRRLAPRLPGDPHVSVVHVGDLADCIWRAATRPSAAGRVYFAAADPSASVGDLIGLIGGALRVRPLRLPVPAPLLLGAGALSGQLNRLRSEPVPFDMAKAREMLRGGWVCSAERAAAELGWRPRVGHAEGLAETAAWYRRQGWL
jgi:nucleoside-diphosphate-sugar epimerase